jgi:hypothetical protein
MRGHKITFALDRPDDLDDELVKALEQANTEPDIAWAIEKTGLIVTESNKHLFTPEQLKEWYDRIEEFRAAERELQDEKD